MEQWSVVSGHPSFRSAVGKGVDQVSPDPNPCDLLSASLAACTAMTVRFQVQRQKLPLQLEAANLCPLAILGIGAAIHTLSDHTISRRQAGAQASCAPR